MTTNETIAALIFLVIFIAGLALTARVIINRVRANTDERIATMLADVDHDRVPADVVDLADIAADDHLIEALRMNLDPDATRDELIKMLIAYRDDVRNND